VIFVVLQAKLKHWLCIAFNF